MKYTEEERKNLERILYKKVYKSPVNRKHEIKFTGLEFERLRSGIKRKKMECFMRWESGEIAVFCEEHNIPYTILKFSHLIRPKTEEGLKSVIEKYGNNPSISQIYTNTTDEDIFEYFHITCSDKEIYEKYGIEKIS